MKVKFDERIELDCVSIPQIVWETWVTKYDAEMEYIVLYHNLCLLLILWLSSKTYIAHFGDPRLLVIQVFWWYNIILVIQDFWWYTTYQNALASSIQRRQTKSNYLVIQDIWWSDIFLLQDMGAESMTRRSRVVPQPKLSLPTVASINIIWHRIQSTKLFL